MIEVENALGKCGALVNGAWCDGTLHEIGVVGSLLEVECEKCGTPAAIPLLKSDPDVRRRLRLERSGVPAMFAGKRFEETLENRAALEAVREWIASFDPLGKAPALWGLAGRGKSHFLAAIAVRLINECDQAVMMVSTRSLLRDLQRFDSDAVRGEAWERATTIDVLALDDVGAQQVTDWRHDQIADLVEERYANGRPVVVATNWPVSQWGQVMDERTASRLRGMTFPVELCGVDRRQTDNEGSSSHG